MDTDILGYHFPSDECDMAKAREFFLGLGCNLSGNYFYSTAVIKKKIKSSRKEKIFYTIKFAMYIDTVFFVVVCAALLWVTAGGLEGFPFSAYPMFSRARKLNNVKVYRIAVEKQNGDVCWWQSRFYRYPEFAASKLARIYDVAAEDPKTKAVNTLEKNRILLEVLRLIHAESRDDHDYKAFHIVARTIGKDMQPADQTVEIVPVTSLKNGRFV